MSGKLFCVCVWYLSSLVYCICVLVHSDHHDCVVL